MDEKRIAEIREHCEKVINAFQQILDQLEQAREELSKRSVCKGCPIPEGMTDEEVTFAIEQVKSGTGQWIPVTERLPEETECGTDVLVAIKYGDELDSDKTITCCGYLLDGEWWTYREHDCGRVGSKPLNKGDKVVYWMPLPEPPKKGE